MSTWQLSFADNGEWRGAVILEANGMLEAVFLTHLLKLNPGGEVLGIEWPETIKCPPSYMNRLLTKDGLKELDRAIGGAGEVETVETTGEKCILCDDHDHHHEGGGE